MNIAVTVRAGEPITHALARLRRKAKRDGLLREIQHSVRRYSPPSVERQQQISRAKWKRKKHKKR